MQKVNGKQKIIVIGGPTGSGKTSSALELAKEINGELVNADSRQIYRYLNIGTNKGDIKSIDGKDYLDGIRIHLVNQINPNERFDLYRFQSAAYLAIEDILSRGKPPIIVGGTGLYIDSILKNYKFFENSTNQNREHLEDLNKEDLQNFILTKINPKPDLNKSDWNNPRRLIRYIEKSGSSTKIQEPKYDSIFLYPQYSRDNLKTKIFKRVNEMFEQGLVSETKHVLNMGYTQEDPGLKIMGYKEAIQLIQKKISIQEAIKLVQTSHWQYARRQITWFEGVGRDYQLTKYSEIQKIFPTIQKFLDN